MKKYLKETWFSYILVFVVCFMFFIFEPISMYAGSMDDFWFDYRLLFSINTIAFLICFIVGIVIMSIIYFINKKVFKIINVISFICFICTYIQGNYLVGNLPVINVDTINWNDIYSQNYISIIIWLIMIIASIVICKFVKIDNYLKYSGYISIAIFLMLTTGLIPSLLKDGVLQEKKVVARATTKDINKYSSNKNTIVVMLDCIDSTDFANAIEKNSEYKNLLKDFTYYPDTVSTFTFTRESVAQIFTGKKYNNKEKFNDYFNNGMDNSPLFDLLEKNDYEINLYEIEYSYNSDKYKRINNFDDYSERNNQVKGLTFVKQELKYSLFRYLPFVLKRYSNIETFDFKLAEQDKEFDDVFDWENLEFVKTISEDFTKDDRKNFKFIHLSGAHYPFVLMKDFSESEENGNYYTEIEACLHMLDLYIQKLKDTGIYDNSSIVIMSDHGYNFKDEVDDQDLAIGRQNPVLYVKGINDNNKKTIRSDKKISYDYIHEIFTSLINNKKGSEVADNINISDGRIFYNYRWKSEDYMREYKIDGHAWESDKAYPTGVIYSSK